jgi:hypothetical protein
MDPKIATDALAVANSVVQANGGAPLSPTTLSAIGGALMSHIIQPHLATLNPKLKPIVALAAPAIVSAATAMSNGVSWQSAAGYGVVTAVGAVVNHWAFFKSDGFKAVLAGIAGAIAKK